MRWLTVFIILAIAAAGTYLFFTRTTYLENALEAELKGEYQDAFKYYCKTIQRATQTFSYPDKDNAITMSEEQWIQKLENYIAWVGFSALFFDAEYMKALEGIQRIAAYNNNENFITGKIPKPLNEHSLATLWQKTFMRENSSAAEKHRKCAHTVFTQNLSFLAIRTMNGFVYRVSLLDIETGRRTDIVLYPNSSKHILVRPGKYYLVCNSQAVLSPGRKGKARKSKEDIIVLTIHAASLQEITLKTSIRRS